MAKTSKKGKIIIDRERCKGCQICIDVCPTENIKVDESLNKKGYYPARPKADNKDDQQDCTACTQCATVCPEVAIEVYRAQ